MEFINEEYLPSSPARARQDEALLYKSRSPIYLWHSSYKSMSMPAHLPLLKKSMFSDIGSLDGREGAELEDDRVTHPCEFSYRPGGCIDPRLLADGARWDTMSDSRSDYTTPPLTPPTGGVNTLPFNLDAGSSVYKAGEQVRVHNEGELTPPSLTSEYGERRSGSFVNQCCSDAFPSAYGSTSLPDSMMEGTPSGGHRTKETVERTLQVDADRPPRTLHRSPRDHSFLIERVGSVKTVAGNKIKSHEAAAFKDVVPFSRPTTAKATSRYSKEVAQILETLPTSNPVCTQKGCNYGFCNRLRVAEHIVVSHLGLKPECIMGCRGYSRKDALLRHRNGNNGCCLICIGCGKGFKTKKKRFEHEMQSCVHAEQNRAYGMAMASEPRKKEANLGIQGSSRKRK